MFRKRHRLDNSPPRIYAHACTYVYFYAKCALLNRYNIVYTGEDAQASKGRLKIFDNMFQSRLDGGVIQVTHQLT